MTKRSSSIRANCPSCLKETNHRVIAEHSTHGDENYNCRTDYRIVECAGCDEASFLYQYHDFEAAYPISDDDWEVPIDTRNYPKSIPGHAAIKELYWVPDSVANIYRETLLAIKEEAAILAGVGLRGTVEAICADLQIAGRDLATKITKLASTGRISAKDAGLLHAIRFMGNDAAHEMKGPSKRQIPIALRIVEHMIASIYVLEKEAAGELETPISEYEEFEALLKKKLKEFSSGDEFPLAKFFGRDVRRLPLALSTLENELVNKITSGDMKTLSIGKIDTFNASPTKLQHFIVV